MSSVGSGVLRVTEAQQLVKTVEIYPSLSSKAFGALIKSMDSIK